MQKRAVSDVVATVIIIALVIVAVVVVWIGILPLIRERVGSSDICSSADLSIEMSQGYTCYQANNITVVQVKKGSNNVNISGIKFLLSSAGSSTQYVKDFLFGRNSFSTFYLNSSKISKLDKIEIVPVVRSGKATKDCSAVFVEGLKNCNPGQVQGVLSDTSCVPNCACAANTAFGKTCFDGCSGSCDGTKQDGSTSYPYVITNCTVLQQTVPSHLSSYFVLWNDIDCTFDTRNSAGALWNGGLGFAPINSFSGTFNGSGHTITGLYINRPAEDYAALFGSSSGNIFNLGLVNVNITGNKYVGGMVGNLQGTISNCYTTGNVASAAHAGGLVGYQSTSVINNSYSFVNATGTSGNSFCGGISGYQYGNSNTAVIVNSYSTGKMVSAWRAGGLVAWQVPNGGAISNTYWDITTSGQSSSSGGGTGIATSAQMKMQATYQPGDPNNWDFVNTWAINPLKNNGYPYLKWQNL